MAWPVTGNFATDLSDVLGGLADLAWPVVAVVALVMFKREIAALFQRIRRASTPVGDFELDQALDRARESTDRASESVPEKPAEPPSAQERLESAETTVTEEMDAAEADAAEAAEAEADKAWAALKATDHGRDTRAWPWLLDLAWHEDPGAYILAEAARSPKASLMTLSALIDRRSREVLASSQDPRAWKGTSLHQKLTRLDLSPSLRDAAREFQDVRNKIVHGHDATDADALSAIDIGLELLSAINRLPHEIHHVVEPRVEVFADENGETPYTDFHGVLLESVSETHHGKKKTRRSITHAFPTTRNHFKKGKPVSWEWVSGRSYPEAWYRDPRDEEVMYGWTSSLEFVGRPLEDL